MNNGNYLFRLTFLVLIFIFTLLTTSIEANQKKFTGKKSITATGSKVFIFDPKQMYWAVYGANGKLIRSGHAAGGKKNCADIHRPCMTPAGTFHIQVKKGPDFRSSKYPLPNGGADMPWAMFFHKGYAIHGSNEVPNHPVSHGCIRVYPGDAKWLNQVLPIGTKVISLSS